MGGSPDDHGPEATPEEFPAETTKRVLELLVRRNQTVSVAESLTGGLLGATLTAVPGSSAAFRGGVISYATDLKAQLLGVPSALLEAHGAVHPDVAAAMARGVRDVTGATFGLAVTGVAGPDPQDGQPVGTVFIALAASRGDDLSQVYERGVRLSGTREEIRQGTVGEALDLLRGVLEADSGEHKG